MTTELKKHPRVDVADALRGFAVLAIILLHSIEHFNFYSFPSTDGQSAWLNFTDKAIWDGLFFAFGGKAYAIFALLFGFSFFIQHDNQRLRGNDFRARFCWRLLILFVIGNINAAFFTGEILVLYALVGFVLVLTCRLSDRTVIALATICLLQPVAIYNIARILIQPGFEPASLDWMQHWQAANDAQTNSDFWTAVKVNLWSGQLFSLGWAWDHGRVFQTAGLFMTGMLIGRRGLFGKAHLALWGRVLTIALVCFFPLYGISNMMGNFVTNTVVLSQLKIIIPSLSNLAFMAVLVSGIIFGFYCTRHLSAVLALLIPYGKLSMTNYVTQGIVGSAIFYHWGLYARMGITASVLLGVAIFLVQYAFCRFWVGRHNHGPLEYIWKKATWLWSD